jgi:phosphoenolpyruvate carboxykinase (ATP)
MTTGRVNPGFRLEDQGIKGLGNVYYNLIEAALVEAALKRNEGAQGNGGTLLVSTGEFTGRSPTDKFIVRTEKTENEIWWENNAPMDPEAFDRLHRDMLAHMAGGDYFVQDLIAGADQEHSINVRVINDLAVGPSAMI